MNVQRLCAAQLAFACILLCFTAGFSQENRGQTFSLTAVIERVDEKFRFIVVNEAKVFVSPETTIVDAKGALLRASDLRSRLAVSLEVIRGPDGFLAKKIVVKSSMNP